MKTKERNIFLDLLKILAIFMVILTHSMALEGVLAFASIAVPLFLVITGYNYTNSGESKNISFKDYYRKKNLWRKLKRILIPYFVIVILHIILFFSLNLVHNIKKFFIYLLFGGFGDGGYYTFLMLQIILLFPLIQYCIKRWKWKSLAIIALIQFLFEVLVNLVLPSTAIVDRLYRLTILRQILYIAFGCYAFYHKNRITDMLSCCFIIIGLLMFMFFLKGIYQPIIFTRWTTTTMLFSLLPMGIVYFATKSRPISSNKLFIITLISNSTYHIFLIQQTYFYIIRRINFAFSGVWVNTAICFCLGIIFYLLEVYIIKLIKKVYVKTRANRAT